MSLTEFETVSRIFFFIFPFPKQRLVGNINLVVDKRRVDQSRVRLAEVEIGDETGTVSLRARDEQIDLLERVRSKGKPRAVVLRNCTLELYQGKHIRLAVTKWGKITEYPDNVASTPGPPPTMNLDRNFSFIDLSLVASEISEKNQSDSLPYASAATATPTSRQAKKADPKTSRSTSSSGKTSAAQSKQGQSVAKQQQQQQQQTSRRGSRSSGNEQRRQARNNQYGGMKVDTTQPSRPGQMMYHGVQQGYHSYGEQSMDMHMRQQYPPHSAYAHSHIHSQSPRQQDAASAQYANALHHQYEMQQRQLHQLYAREQNRHVGQVHHHQQQTSPMLLRHMSSFDASTGSYAGDISMSSELGTSPNMVPPPDHYSQSPKMEDHPGLQQESPQSTAAYASMGPMAPYRIGKMNPEASSFAPSYLSAAQQGSSSQQQMTAIPAQPQYPSYNLSQQQQQQSLSGASMYPSLQSAHHQPFFMPATVSSGAYHHPLPQTGLNTSLERDLDGKTESAATATTTSRSHHHHQYGTGVPSAKESAPSSGKENVTSKP